MDYKVYLKMQEPINFQNIIIYQTEFGEILKYGVEKFGELLLPYFITLDSLGIPEEEQSKYNIFTDIIMKDDSILAYLIKSLKYLCKCNCIWIYDDCIRIKNGILNSRNFEEFSKIILEIHAREKPAKERIPIFANDRQKDIWTKLQEGRRRSAKNNELKLEDVINIIQYGGKSYIPKEKIREMTLWEMMNGYKTILGISNYNDSFGIYLVSGEKSLIEGKHWTEVVKIDYKSKE